MAIAPISFSGFAPNLPNPGQALGIGPTPTLSGDSPAVNVAVTAPTPVLNITAQSGDLYRIATLFQGTAPPGVDPNTLTFHVALRGGGQLLLNGQPVDPTIQTSFTALQFNQLSFSAGASSSDIAVSVATPSGASATPVQVTATTGAQRSTNALAAFDGNDPFANLAFIANLVATTGGAGPSLDTVGNLISATAPTGQTITQYSVAVRGGGQLLLNGQAIDPNTQTTFTSDQLNQLTFVNGSSSSDILVSARTGTTSSQAIAITANVGINPVDRTINAAGALDNPDAYGLIGFIAQLSQSPTAASNPSLATIGNFTAVAGQSYLLSNLYQAQPPASGGAITKFSVAVAGGGTLQLNGVTIDPNQQTGFTPDQFAQLSFVAGSSDSKLVVSAQNAGGSSKAVEIGAATGSQTSVNALPASFGNDPYSLVALSANLQNASAGAAAPRVTTVGNFSGHATDQYRLAGLFNATPASSQSITGFQVALRGAGQLLLNGTAVLSTQTSFTPDQFQQLTFAAGAGPSDLLVSAQSGTASSRAVQITNSIGDPSINAAGALPNPDAFSLIGFTAALQQNGGLGKGPSLASAGNFDAVSGQAYRLANLFSATPSGSHQIDHLSVAVRGGGTLFLNGQAVDPTVQTVFTADQFQQLSFVAGSTDSDLVVAAQSGLTSSQALQITATTATTTSLNAGAAASASSFDPFLFLGFTASLSTASNPASLPKLAATGSPTDPALAIGQAQTAVGLSESTGFANATDANAANIANLYLASATGGFTLIGPTPATSPSIVQILAEANSGLGSVQTSSPSTNGQRYEVQAYVAAGRLGS